MTLAEIEKLPLHDATLKSVEVLWAEARCRLFLELAAGSHVLEFGGVTRVAIPREAPWGRSVSVNGVSVKGGVAAIEMQSGDTIEVSASEAEFSAI
jgi:hypothetical protein